MVLKAKEKKWFLRWHLKRGHERACMMCSGKSSHNYGATTTKVLKTVIDPSRDKSMCYCLKVSPRWKGFYFGELPQLEKACLDNRSDLTLELQVRVHFDPEVCEGWLFIPPKMLCSHYGCNHRGSSCQISIWGLMLNLCPQNSDVSLELAVF